MPADAGGPTCADRRGFLFDHPCGRSARTQCVKCQMPICDLHTCLKDGAPYCTHCASGFAQQSGWFNDSPYFYGARYYGGYRNYWLYDSFPDYYGFNSSDGASTVNQGEPGFENDLGAS